MTTPLVLQREARVFTRGLLGRDPTAYVVERYVAAHVALPLVPVAGFDRILTAFAASGPLRARLADAYARLFFRRATVRGKLALLLAILESASPSDASFAPIVTSSPGVVFRLAFSGLGAVICAGLGVLILGPLHLVSRLAVSRS